MNTWKKKLPDSDSTWFKSEKKNTHHIETILCERTAILEDFLLSIISMIEQKVEISGKCEYLPLLDYTQYTSSYNLVLSQWCMRISKDY